MNFTDLNDEIRRVHKQFTEEVTVYNYSWDSSAGSNEYADGDWTRVSSTVQASIRLPEDTEYSNDAAGNESSHDVEIYVAPNEVDLTVDGGDETRATEFEANGRTYKAVGFHDESSLYRVQCREVE